jgi:hypothetical protein
MRLVPTLCALAVATGAHAATPDWLEVKSPHFTVLTNSGEKSGRRAAWQFEQIHAALAHLWPWATLDSGRPFVVFAVRDEATLKTLGPEYWEGKRYRPISFSVRGSDKHFVALRTDVRPPDDGSNPYQSAYFSYTSAVFNRSFPRRLPVWYARGIAEVMSNTIVRDEELHVGRPLRANIELLRERAPVPIKEFLVADYRSHWLTQEADTRLFDAQAWALVHYLLFGEKGAHIGRLNRFNTLLRNATQAESALQEAFGDMARYHEGMRAYVERSLFGYVRMPVSVETRAEAYASRPLSAGEVAVRCGELLVAMDRPVEARAFAATAAKADPSLPGPWEIEAELLDTGQGSEQAKAAYRKAAEAGSLRARVYYRLAQLEWNAGLDQPRDKPQLSRLASWLDTARVLDPKDAAAHSFLAQVRDELEQREEALALATKAVELEPGESYHRLTMARILWNAGRSDESLQMAKTALQTADGDEEQQHAQRFLDFAARR